MVLSTSERAALSSEADRKKRLGQYMTGTPLAQLLAALANAETAETLIDPMVGIGDMLFGCIAQGARPRLVGGIEIDPIAHAQCIERLGPAFKDRATVVLGDAFDITNLHKLPTLSWDLVITNPPYVRYQSTARSSETGIYQPSALEIRNGLIDALDILPALDSTDRKLFGHLAEGYSGFADLAVPSWMLSAALVKPGGMLAMVVPEAWLSRDYAHPIQYLLARWFDLRFVVEDSCASWFPDALVKTTLVVAQRTDRKPSALMPDKESGYLRVRLQDAADHRSVVGGIYPDEKSPVKSFVDDLDDWRTQRCRVQRGPVTAEWVPSEHTTTAIESASRKQQWFHAVETGSSRLSVASTSPAVSLPLELSALLGSAARRCVTLDMIGWRTGQGLRTGANPFFYSERAGGTSRDEVLITSQLMGAATIKAPRDSVLPVLRRQSDLPKGLIVRADDLPGRVFLLDRYALPEDIDSSISAGAEPTAVRRALRTLPDGLATYIRHASTTRLKGLNSKKIPELSAVITNVRSVDRSKRDVLPKFWYQLPPLADRHRPELAIPRVNYGHPSPYLNRSAEAIIDANFSTLWRETPSVATGPTEHALVALLSSAWCAAALELSGTVLGGGALKIEATHLRRLPLPPGTAELWKELSALGQRLVTARPAHVRSIQDRIDLAVMRALVGSEDEAERSLATVRRLGDERLTTRSS